MFFVQYIYCILTKMKCVDPGIDAAGVAKSIIRLTFIIQSI